METMVRNNQTTVRVIMKLKKSNESVSFKSK